MKHNHNVSAEYTQLTPENMYDTAREISENIVDKYYNNIFDEVYVIYNNFVSALASDLITKINSYSTSRGQCK